MTRDGALSTSGPERGPVMKKSRYVGARLRAVQSLI
jgi:hypothetical protein